MCTSNAEKQNKNIGPLRIACYRSQLFYQDKREEEEEGEEKEN